MSQPSWDMDEDSRTSGGSGPHSPQLNTTEALLRANTQLEALVRHYQSEHKELKDHYLELGKNVDALQEELKKQDERLYEYETQLQAKTSKIGTLNDEIRTLKETICKLESRNLNKGDKHDFESEISLEEETNSDEDAYLEVRSTKKRRKRKSQRGSTQENAKVKKVINDQESEDQMDADDLYDENFPPMGINQQRNKMPASQKSNNTKNNGKESQRIPPVVLRDKSKYSTLVAELATRKINFNRATTLPEGVKIMPSSSEDFRSMTRLLDERNIEYHSYQLQEDKLLHIVLRGVLESFTEEEIMEDLKRQGFSPKKIVRFKYKNGRPMPLVLVLVPKQDKGIFNITEIYYNSIKVEAQRTRTRSTQCYNCQMYGHSAFGCKAKPKCVKCAGEHSSKSCSLRKEENKAKCVNCGGNHPASFGGCPKHPRNLNNQQQKAPQRKEFKWGTQENFKLAATPENMGAATNAIKLMNSAMEEFMKNLQKMQMQFASAFMPTSSVGIQE